MKISVTYNSVRFLMYFENLLQSILNLVNTSQYVTFYMTSQINTNSLNIFLQKSYLSQCESRQGEPC